MSRPYLLRKNNNINTNRLFLLLCVCARARAWWWGELFFYLFFNKSCPDSSESIHSVKLVSTAK